VAQSEVLKGEGFMGSKYRTDRFKIILSIVRRNRAVALTARLATRIEYLEGTTLKILLEPADLMRGLRLSDILLGLPS
jgi:hypothetical protein